MQTVADKATPRSKFAWKLFYYKLIIACQIANKLQCVENYRKMTVKINKQIRERNTKYSKQIVKNHNHLSNICL